MTDLPLKLTRNDGTEEFVIKADQVRLAISSSTTIKAVLSVAGGLAGADPVLAKETYQIQLNIKGVESGDYPNSGTYAGMSGDRVHNYGMHSELRRAYKEWGPTKSDGFDTLHYDGRTISGMMSDLQLTENPGGNEPPRQYTGQIEWSHASVYIG